MADQTNTNHLEMRKVTPEHIKELTEHPKARAAPKWTKNASARDHLLLASALLDVIKHEHPDGLTVEVFTPKNEWQEWGAAINGSPHKNQ